jgi:D-glycero-D-manno-heptose 1,7-bisphosphate phosphatase
VIDTANSFLRSPLRTVFLDRDGVLNRKMPEGRYVTRWSEFEILPGVPQAIAKLNRAGIRVVVVTNQRGVSQGLYTLDEVRSIHAAFQSDLQTQGARIDGFYICPHSKSECSCRKPLPGLFEQARADFPNIAAASSVMIGDSLSDIEFGQRLGMRTIFIEGDPAHQKPGVEAARQLADQRFHSLLEATEFLLAPKADVIAPLLKRH